VRNPLPVFGERLSGQLAKNGEQIFQGVKGTKDYCVFGLTEIEGRRSLVISILHTLDSRGHARSRSHRSVAEVLSRRFAWNAGSRRSIYRRSARFDSN
jgi:hypothetical protein